MGGSTPPAFTQTQTNLDPAIRQGLMNTLNGMTQSGAAYSKASTNAANNYGTNFNQFNPNINTNFSQYTPNLNTGFTGSDLNNQTLSPFSQNIVSQGWNNINARNAGVNSQIAGQFGASNPGLSGVLQSQNNINSSLSGNPMNFQAAANQSQLNATQVGLNQQAQALQNQALLGQAAAGAGYQQMGNQAGFQAGQFGANLQGMSNAALGQRAQLSAQPFNMQSSLLNALGNVGQLTGQQTVAPNQNVYGSIWPSQLVPNSPISQFQMPNGQMMPGLQQALNGSGQGYY